MAKNIYFKNYIGALQRVGAAYAMDAIGNRTHLVKGYAYDANGVRQQFYPGLTARTAGIALSSNAAFAPIVTQDNLAGTLSAVLDGSYTGYKEGLEGSITPEIHFFNGRVVQLFTVNLGSSIQFEMSFASDPGQTIFNNFTVDAWPDIFYAASASYSFGFSTATWIWSTARKFVDNTTYNILVVR